MKENKFRMIFTCFLAVILVAAVITSGYVIFNTDRLYTPVDNTESENSDESDADQSEEISQEQTVSEEESGGFFEPDDKEYSEDASVDKPVTSKDVTSEEETESEPASSEDEGEASTNVPSFSLSVPAGMSGEIGDSLPNEMKDSFYRCDIIDFEGISLTLESDGSYQAFGEGKTTVGIYDENDELIAEVNVSVTSDETSDTEDEETGNVEITERDVKLQVKGIITYLTSNGVGYDRNMDRSIFDYGQDDALTEAAEVNYITISEDSGIDSVTELENELRTYASSAIGNYEKFNCVYQKQSDSSYTIVLLFA